VKIPFWLVLGWALAVAAMPAGAAPVTATDVIFKVEAEACGLTGGLAEAQMEGAVDGVSAILGDERTGITWAGELAAGDYALLLRTWAPAGDQDAFFVEINGQRTRYTVPQKEWATLVLPLRTTETSVNLRIIGQETGLALDQVALIRGVYRAGQVRLEDVPGTGPERAQVDPSRVPRLAMGAKLPVVPSGPLTKAPGTVLLWDFEALPHGTRGDAALAPGKFGQALNLPLPDGRLDVPLGGLGVAAQGTVEFWCRPRPAQMLWYGNGQHWLLHLEAGSAGPRLDLRLHPDWVLELRATSLDGQQSDGVPLMVRNLDAQAWHHVLVSWNFAAPRQQLWLLVDGAGESLGFPAKFTPAEFTSLQLYNTPDGADLPLMPVDGLLDDLRVSNCDVAHLPRPGGQ
jgi:hypothetical protein